MRSRTQPDHRAGHDEHDENDSDYVVKRVTIGIIPKAWEELITLMQRTRFNRTDVINRAISVYHMVDEQLRNGQELVFRDPKSKKEKIVEII